MKPEKLYELLGSINETLISRAGKARKNKRKAIVIRTIASVACLVLVVTGVSLYAHNLPVNNDEIGYIEYEKGEDTGTADGADGAPAPDITEDEPPNNSGATPPGNNSSAGGSEQSADPAEPPKENQSQQTVYPVVSPIAKTLGAAVYPTALKVPQESDYGDYDSYSAAYKSWRVQQSEILSLKTDSTGNGNFTKNTAAAILKGLNGKNRVYSPASLYISLSMLAEVTSGDTQKEIMSALGKSADYDIQTNVSNLWQKLYRDNGIIKSIIANSLWLRDDIEYNTKTIEILKNKYFASSFAGDFKTQEYAQAMRNWLDEQTGGMLKDEIQKLNFDNEQADVVAVFASTLYFNAKWDNKFDKKATKAATFHSQGGDVTVDFMNDTVNQNYLQTESFSATECEFEDGGKMIFILPSENKTVDDILGDTGVKKLLTGDTGAMEKYRINLSIPKFDITCDVDLKDSLNTMGINTVFNTTADFSPLTSAYDYIWLDDVKQTTRIKIDEDGCEASSYTLMTMIGDASSQYDEVNFTLDRPFIFVVTGEDDLPRFIGVVNQP